jgi:hypothetical protein
MKNSIIISSILLCLVACNKKESKSTAVATPTALSKLQGTWDLCTDSGGTDGDYRFTQVISNYNVTYTEHRYASDDGSCSGAILRITNSYSFTIGTDTPVLWPEATPINATFTGPTRMTLLTSDPDAVSEVTRCTAESSPVVGSTYDVDSTSCTGAFIKDGPISDGQIVYTIAYVDTDLTPDRLFFGSEGGADDGTSIEKRHEYLLSTEFIKQ